MNTATAEALFDKRLESQTHDEVVKEAFVVVHEKMKTAMVSALAAFGDHATPEHAIAIFDRMEECAQVLIDEEEDEDE